MAKIIEVTNDVDHENPDDEELPITKCVCGAEFKPWEHTISIYPEDAYECPKCGVKLYFIQTIKIYQIVEKEVEEKDKREINFIKGSDNYGQPPSN